MSSWTKNFGCWYLFLLHELGIRHIIDHTFAKARRGEDGIYLLGIDVLEFPIQNELITLGSQIDGDFSAEENECEDVPIL